MVGGVAAGALSGPIGAAVGAVVGGVGVARQIREGNAQVLGVRRRLQKAVTIVKKKTKSVTKKVAEEKEVALKLRYDLVLDRVQKVRPESSPIQPSVLSINPLRKRLRTDT